MNLEDTCNTDCPFWKKYKERCPNFLKTTWSPHDTQGTPVLMNDCAPKRSVLMQMEVTNRVLGLQKDVEEDRNAQRANLLAMAEMARQGMEIPQIEMLDAQYDTLLIEDKNEDID
ncbi:MAG: hypothetical protein ACYTE8_00430 [Planctomycetota bacterium]|jgi:hypothetical protein